MAKVQIFNPKAELQKLEDKVAKLSPEDRVCPSLLLVPKSACKEAEWDEELVEQAIERGRTRSKGEEVGEAPWADLEDKSPEETILTGRTSLEGAQDFLRTGDVPDTPQVSGSEAAETESSKPGRLFNLLGDLQEQESGEQEEVRSQRSPLFGVKEDDLWDCPVCSSVNTIDETVCPGCNLNRTMIEIKVLALVSQIDTSSYTNKEHLEFLNSITIIKRRNETWTEWLKAYVEHYNLKPEDLVGLQGDLPWEEKKVETAPEKMSTSEELSTALRSMAEKKEPGSTPDIFEKALRDKAAKKAEGAPEASLADLKSAFEDKAAEVADSDPRKRVIVGEEVGWLCPECERVWSLEYKRCIVCDKEYRAEVETARAVAKEEIPELSGKEKMEHLLQEKAKGKTGEVEPIPLTKNEKIRSMLILKSVKKEHDDDNRTEDE